MRGGHRIFKVRTPQRYSAASTFQRPHTRFGNVNAAIVLRFADLNEAKKQMWTLINRTFGFADLDTAKTKTCGP